MKRHVAKLFPLAFGLLLGGMSSAIFHAAAGIPATTLHAVIWTIYIIFATTTAAARLS